MKPTCGGGDNGACGSGGGSGRGGGCTFRIREAFHFSVSLADATTEIEENAHVYVTNVCYICLLIANAAI